MSAGLLVPIIVTDSVAEPDGANAPTGRITFQLTTEIIAPQECSAKVVGAQYAFGRLAQQLIANDLDSNGDAISPATTMYRVAQSIDGAAEQDFFITVPAVPPGSRTVEDCVTEAGVNTITSATANFTDDDLNAYVLVGNPATSGVPPGTTITEVISATEATISQTPNADLTDIFLMVGASVSLGQLRPPE